MAYFPTDKMLRSHIILKARLVDIEQSGLWIDLHLMSDETFNVLR